MAFLIAIALFGYFGIIGLALAVLLYRRSDRIRTLLIAPTIGVLTIVYATYLLSRIGLPIAVVAAPLTLALLVAASAILAWRRPGLPGRRFLPYLGILGLAFCANGWPLLSNGFSWLSVLNPDAANYILQADRFAAQSFAPPPDPGVWLDESDWSAYYVLNSLRHVRSGTDLLLAWAATVAGYDEPQLYMPLIVALHVAGLCGAAALIGTAYRLARLLGFFLLAAAALSSIGVTLQLLGQELGLAGLSVNAVLLLSPFYRLSQPALVRYGVLAAVALAGFILSYPEMLPFLGLGFIIYHGRWAKELIRSWRPALAAGAAIAAATMLLIAPDFWGLLQYLFQQASAAGVLAGPQVFPYFLIPGGIGALWGLKPYAPPGTSLLGDDGAISIGIVLSGLVVAATSWSLRRGEPVAGIMMVMMVLGLSLFLSGNGFGVFKLAMYTQPFLFITAAIGVCAALRVVR
jgi:hypothetical protein